MKKIVFCTLALYLSFNAFTQTAYKSITATVDTLRPASYKLSCYSAAFEAYAFDVNSQGFITGSNYKKDTKYAQIYRHGSGSGLCTGISVDMVGETSSGPGNIQAHIYSLKNNLPDSLLGSSVAVAGNSLSLTQLYPDQYFFTFTTPVPVSQDFAAVIEIPDLSVSANFIASVISTQIGCVPASSEKRSCVYNAQSKQWTFLADTRTRGGNAMHVDLHIYPIINGDYTPAGIEDMDAAASSVSVYPNPVQDILNVVSMNKIEKLQIYNAMGQIVFEENTHNLQAKIHVDFLNSGNYIIKVETGKGSITKKLLITK